MKVALGQFAFCFLLLAPSGGAVAQNGEAARPQTAAPADKGNTIELDRVVAIINGDVLLDSDVEDEMRMATLQPYVIERGRNTRQAAIERLINRDLILQQIKDSNQTNLTPSDADIKKSIDQLRSVLPACARYNCKTEEGWDLFLKDNHITREEVDARWRMRLFILRFIEQRFRAGIHITRPEIDKYYTETMLPQYVKENAKPPGLDSVSKNIEEILLQQRVNVLLQDWLKSLKDQGSVEILDPSFKEPTADSGGGSQ